MKLIARNEKDGTEIELHDRRLKADATRLLQEMLADTEPKPRMGRPPKNAAVANGEAGQVEADVK
jgi:hypothetical protein